MQISAILPTQERWVTIKYRSRDIRSEKSCETGLDLLSFLLTVSPFILTFRELTQRSQMLQISPLSWPKQVLLFLQIRLTQRSLKLSSKHNKSFPRSNFLALKQLLESLLRASKSPSNNLLKTEQINWNVCTSDALMVEERISRWNRCRLVVVLFVSLIRFEKLTSASNLHNEWLTLKRDNSYSIEEKWSRS